MQDCGSPRLGLHGRPRRPWGPHLAPAPGGGGKAACRAQAASTNRARRLVRAPGPGASAGAGTQCPGRAGASENSLTQQPGSGCARSPDKPLSQPAVGDDRSRGRGELALAPVPPPALPAARSGPPRGRLAHPSGGFPPLHYRGAPASARAEPALPPREGHSPPPPAGVAGPTAAGYRASFLQTPSFWETTARCNSCRWSRIFF